MTAPTVAPARGVSGQSIAAGVQAKRAYVIAAICNAIDSLPERPEPADIEAAQALVRDEVNRWADNICGSLARLPHRNIDPELLEQRLDEILEALQEP